jgi:hypothetical protein
MMAGRRRKAKTSFLFQYSLFNEYWFACCMVDAETAEQHDDREL